MKKIIALALSIYTINLFSAVDIFQLNYEELIDLQDQLYFYINNTPIPACDIHITCNRRNITCDRNINRHIKLFNRIVKYLHTTPPQRVNYQAKMIRQHIRREVGK